MAQQFEAKMIRKQVGTNEHDLQASKLSLGAI